MPTAKNSKLVRIIQKLIVDGELTLLDGIGIFQAVEFISNNPAGDWIGTEVQEAIDNLVRE